MPATTTHVVPGQRRKLSHIRDSVPDSSGKARDHRNQVVSLRSFINILLSDVDLSMLSATSAAPMGVAQAGWFRDYSEHGRMCLVRCRPRCGRKIAHVQPKEEGLIDEQTASPTAERPLSCRRRRSGSARARGRGLLEHQLGFAG
jgi:hypothetical protein